NPYLEEQVVAARARTVPWEGYHRANLITAEELEQIRMLEQDATGCMRKRPEAFAQLILGLLAKLGRKDTIQSVLISLQSLLTDDPTVANVFARIRSPVYDHASPYTPLLNLLRNEDEFIQLETASILSLLLSRADQMPAGADVSEYYTYLVMSLQNPNPPVVDLIVQFIQTLVQAPRHRVAFYRIPGALSALTGQLRKTTVAQMQYQITCVFWLLTFNQDIAADLQKKYDIVPLLVDIGKTAIKEKVVRVVAATLRNLLIKAPTENFPAMLASHVHTWAETLLTRQWTDDDVREDLTYLHEEVAAYAAKLSTFEAYVAEVRSGKLVWSPPHRSDAFWKVNGERFCEREYEIVRALGRLLMTGSMTPQTLAIAAHDIGQFVKFVPLGKRFLQNSGIKTRIMELMTHDDPDVRQQALMATQK
ncbi:hypothetical protein CXG81DRAFT_5050, partial [Caulochytrium protostelioides]